MPKDEFDFDDPLELNGVALLTDEDTSSAMAECFVEEFMRMGYSHKQILALFRNPHYLGMNMVLQNKGEPFVRDIITEVFARWGKPVTWSVVDSGSTRVPRVESGVSPASLPGTNSSAQDLMTKSFRRDAKNRTPEVCASHQIDRDETPTDPTGTPIPKLNI
jgi:hypothetical protein